MALSIGCGGAELDKGSSGFAPDSIGGKVAITTINGATPAPGGPPSTGNSTITFSATGYTDNWSGGGASTSDNGTYTYTKTSNITGTVVMTETGGAGIVTAVATFTSATSGNYLATAGVDGQETGSFIMD